jgi:hypothetical protein
MDWIKGFVLDVLPYLLDWRFWIGFPIFCWGMSVLGPVVADLIRATRGK